MSYYGFLCCRGNDVYHSNDVFALNSRKSVYKLTKMAIVPKDLPASYELCPTFKRRVIVSLSKL